MGSVSINTSLSHIWKTWYKFRSGKKTSIEMEQFTYNLETSLKKLHADIENKSYKHGKYKQFTVNDNKKREIQVASIRDRVIHRLLYEYLVPIYDKTFIFDAWSCRKDKGLLGAIERTQKMALRYKDNYVWRSDITKFFDNISHEKLLNLLTRRVSDKVALWLLEEVINSYFINTYKETGINRKKGIPIGNLTSQIFSNIYLNEFDRFVKHLLKPQFYIRYGDDFLIFTKEAEALQKMRTESIKFLAQELKLQVNPKNDEVFKVKHGIYFLGVEIYPNGRRLKKRNWNRAVTKLNLKNIPSYKGLIMKHTSNKTRKVFDWKIHELIDNV